MNIEELKQTFDMIEESDEKFAFVIELGKQLSPYPQDKKDDEHKIYGCSSNVWFNVTKNDNKYYFDFESDALIVKGLLFIIKTIFDGHNVNEIKTIDAMQFFEANRDENPKFPYHYRLHYSTSGYLLSYLVRISPYTEEQIRFQNNQFDAPSRQIHSIDEIL
ncbi:MAG: SufE family protein [Alphaproteobacteria bacterium]|nr:SufE family protein [Alphaproteobacteria bacterium]